mgnify:CR=1 FL=1
MQGMVIHSRILSLAGARQLPVYRHPAFMLLLMAAAMPVAFATWFALLNNFVIEAAALALGSLGLALLVPRHPEPTVPRGMRRFSHRCCVRLRPPRRADAGKTITPWFRRAGRYILG